MTLVIAHRGASAAEQENTLAAFRRAGAMGADGVELDVRRSVDDHLVVHHDPQLPDGRLIRSTRRSDLPAYVPDLDESLDACVGMFVNIEIKNIRGEPDFDEEDWIIGRVHEQLAPRAQPMRWLISSFNPRTVRRSRQLSPVVRTALLVEQVRDDTLERCADAGHVALHPAVADVSVDLIRQAHGLGLAVNPWTCDDPGRMAELIGWGVDGICTNVPDVALDVRGVAARR